MEATLFRERKKANNKKSLLSDQELYDMVIVLIEHNKVNPRRRWSDLAEKIMRILKLTVVYDEGQEVLYFEDEDKTFV